MTDYIKREDAQSQFSELLEDYGAEAYTVIGEYSCNIDESTKELKKDIAKRKKKFMEIPSADVVEVVRCKDCKWFNRFGCAIEIVDSTDRPKENDYCSFGERKDEEADK